MSDTLQEIEKLNAALEAAKEETDGRLIKLANDSIQRIQKDLKQGK